MKRFPPGMVTAASARGDGRHSRDQGRVTRRTRAISLALLFMLFPMASCIDIQLPELSLLGDGPIVLQGAMSEGAGNACPLWEADIGLRFVLFQDTRVSNDNFDAVTSPGTRSRLELSVRNDIGEPCAEGAQNAEVVGILEIDAEDAPAEGEGGETSSEP